MRRTIHGARTRGGSVAKLTHNTKVFGIMGGLAPMRNIRASTHVGYRVGDARMHQDIPLDPKRGLAYMMGQNPMGKYMLSRNPQCAGGIGRMALVSSRGAYTTPTRGKVMNPRIFQSKTTCNVSPPTKKPKPCPGTKDTLSTENACTTCSKGYMDNNWCYNRSFSGMAKKGIPAADNCCSGKNPFQNNAFCGVSVAGGTMYNFSYVKETGFNNLTYACKGNCGTGCNSLKDKLNKFITSTTDKDYEQNKIVRSFGHVLGGPNNPPGFTATSSSPPCGICYQIQKNAGPDSTQEAPGGAVIFAIDGAAINNDGSVEMGLEDLAKAFGRDATSGRTKVKYRLVDCETLVPY